MGGGAALVRQKLAARAGASFECFRSWSSILIIPACDSIVLRSHHSLTLSLSLSLYVGQRAGSELKRARAAISHVPESEQSRVLEARVQRHRRRQLTTTLRRSCRMLLVMRHCSVVEWLHV